MSYWCPESLSSHEYVDDTEVSEEGHDEEHTEEESECIFDEGVLGRVFAPVLVNDRPELIGEVIQLGGPWQNKNKTLRTFQTIRLLTS